MLDSKGPYVLDVLVPYQEHVLPMIPGGMTVRDIIKAYARSLNPSCSGRDQRSGEISQSPLIATCNTRLQPLLTSAKPLRIVPPLMTTKIRYALGIVVAVAIAWLTGQATEPAPVRATGRVLILENERTLEGDIERQGDQYRVRRSIGETWVPGTKVLRLCDNNEEAYLYLRSRAIWGIPMNASTGALVLSAWVAQSGVDRDHCRSRIRTQIIVRANG